jgi:hypothetical protein
VREGRVPSRHVLRCRVRTYHIWWRGGSPELAIELGVPIAGAQYLKRARAPPWTLWPKKKRNESHLYLFRPFFVASGGGGGACGGGGVCACGEGWGTAFVLHNRLPFRAGWQVHRVDGGEKRWWWFECGPKTQANVAVAMSRSQCQPRGRDHAMGRPGVAAAPTATRGLQARRRFAADSSGSRGLDGTLCCARLRPCQASVPPPPKVR